MQSVVLNTVSVVIALLPIVLIVALLRLSAWHQRRRLAEVARQIAVTDAIHAELGAIVSPIVRKTLGRGWRLTIPVPLERPNTVMQVVEAAYGAFGAAERTKPGRFEIVLTPQEKPVARRTPVLIATGSARGESVSWT